MYFGGIDGTVSFDPMVFAADTVPSSTLITRLRLMNKVVSYRSDPELLPTPISQARELVLPYDTRMITFDLASADLTAPALNAFRYQLEGMDTTWVESGTAHEATYTNLDPGHYTFRVQSRNSAGVWDRQGTELALIITPPWWGTWWFRSLVVLVVAGLLYAFYRYRLAKALEVARVRDRIARDLHDEIGSTLSSVALYSEVALREGGANGSSGTLELIGESTSQMMESMNDIVWAVNSKNDDLLHVARRMRAFAARLTEAAGIALDFHFDEALAERPLSMMQRKNLYLVFKEAVNNAVKHSGAARITVRFFQEQGEYVLQVEDDGSGFEEAGLVIAADSGRGNGLGNMRTRANEMKGRIHLDPVPGNGTRVELRFDP